MGYKQRRSASATPGLSSRSLDGEKLETGKKGFKGNAKNFCAVGPSLQFERQLAFRRAHSHNLETL
jgi:hypothetical protein